MPPSSAAKPPLLNVAARVPRTEAEGPGLRYALWVQGCPLRCPGCCNPHMLEFRQAELLSVQEVLEDVLAADGIEGATFIGGEPFAQAEALAALAKGIRAAGLSVMIFTGFLLENLRAAGRPDYDALLAETDLLIDGPYIRERLVTDRRWIGSANQRAHFLSERYRRLSDEREGWPGSKSKAPEAPGQRNTVELRLGGGKLSINGFPDGDVLALIRKLEALQQAKK